MNTNTYNDRFEAYNRVRAAHERESTLFDNWVRPRAIAHILNARCVVAKHNAKERQRNNDALTLTEFPWATDRMFDLKVKNYTEHAITFSYATSFDYTYPEGRARRFGEKPTTVYSDYKTLEFPIEWLSLSTWDFNSRVRSAIKEEVRQRDLTAKREAEKKARALRKAIGDARELIKAQTEELKRLEAEYSA